ncbi:hypothetical protein NA57DRAFT_56617 [Rhizodiscina lignyota]|uniref:Uncharacterized protein n=1 Tax=Rhizodiscina lignyota TaxID=1504668 RepID=A0A9P4IIW3_9PEZI|nr:hypothetical protein NA57DRAFT_56617 [Rhizodiscina lignyota]
MPLTTLALQAPIDVTAPVDYAPLKWYLHYAATFDADLQALSKTPTRFYNSQAVNYGANSELVNGAKAVFDDYLYLWGDFDHLTREVRSITVVSDEASDVHVFHMEVVTNCHLPNGKGVIGVPTYFVYTAKKADAAETDEKYQFYEIRSYFDCTLVEKGKSMCR